MQQQRLGHEIAMNSELRKKYQLLQDEVMHRSRLGSHKSSAEVADMEAQLQATITRITEVALNRAAFDFAGTTNV